MFYEYLGEGANNTSRYKISLKLYLDCGATSPGQLDPTVNITIFNKGTNQMLQTISAQLASENFLRFDPASNPCIGNPPLDVCYRVRTYSVEIPCKIFLKAICLPFSAVAGSSIFKIY